MNDTPEPLAPLPDERVRELQDLTRFDAELVALAQDVERLRALERATAVSNPRRILRMVTGAILKAFAQHYPMAEYSDPVQAVDRMAERIAALTQEVERLRAIGLVLPKYERAGGLVWTGAATCIHCGKRIYDNGTVYVHRNFDVANDTVFIIETQWCDEADKRFIAETEYTTDVIWTATDAQMAKVRQAADRAKLRFLQNRVAPLQTERDWTRAENEAWRRKVAELEAERDEALRVRDLAREASNRDLEAKRAAEAENERLSSEVLDYIKALVKARRESGEWEDRHISLQVERADLLERFADALNVSTSHEDWWELGWEAKRDKLLARASVRGAMKRIAALEAENVAFRKNSRLVAALEELMSGEDAAKVLSSTQDAALVSAYRDTLRDIALALGLRADAEPDAVLAGVKDRERGVPTVEQIEQMVDAALLAANSEDELDDLIVRDNATRKQVKSLCLRLCGYALPNEGAKR